MRFHQGARAGDLIYRASWDTYAVQTLFQQGLMTCAGAVLSLAVMLAVMARMNVCRRSFRSPWFRCCALTIKTFGDKMRVYTTLAQQEDSRVTSRIQQAIAALPLTQSYTPRKF